MNFSDMKLYTANSKLGFVVISGILLPLFLGILSNSLFGNSVFVFKHIHEYFEIAGTVISFGVAVLLILRLYHEDPAIYFMWIVFALIGMGIIDGIHAIIHFDEIWVWLQHIATLIGGILFALVWLPVPRFAVKRKLLSSIIFSILIASFITIIFKFPNLLPEPVSGSDYSSLVKIFNIGAGFCFLISTSFFIRKYLNKSSNEILAFIGLTSILGITGLMYGFSHLWTAYWWILHLFRLIAYVIVFITAFQYLTLIFNFISDQLHDLRIHSFTLEKDIIIQYKIEEELRKNKEALESLVNERTIELSKTNEQLIHNLSELARINEELKNARRAALNLTEDAVTAKLIAEELNRKLTNEILIRKSAEYSLLRTNERYRLLSTVAGELLASDEPQKLVKKLCTDIMNFLDCQVFFNYLININDNKLYLNAYHGIPESEYDKIKILDIESRICGEAASKGKMIVVEDIQNSLDPHTDLIKSFNIRAYCCRPLLVQGNSIGTLSFGTTTRDHFNNDEIDLMRTVSDQVAIAMQRIDNEKKLKHAAQQWKITFDSIPDMVSIQAKDLTLLNVNKAYEKMFGLKAHELIGKKCFEIVHQRDCPVKNCVHLATMKSRKTETQEIYEPLLNVFLEATTSPLFDENREFLGTVHVAKDITERKLAEKKLQESEEQFRMLTEAMPQIVWSADETGNVIFYNRYAYEYAGVINGDIEGRKWIKTIHKDDIDESLNKWKYAISTGNVFNFEQRILRGDGIYRWHLTRGVPVKDSDGKIIRWIGTATDIHEQKNSEEILEKRVLDQTQELKKIGEYNRNLIETSLDPFVTIGPNGKITDVNHATELTTGLQRNNIIGSDFSNYFTEPEKAKAGYLKAFKEGKVKDFPLTIQHVSGNKVPVLYNASIFRDEYGDVQGIFAIARDITEIKKAQQNLAMQADRHNTMLSTTPDGFWVFNNEGKLLDVNNVYLSMSGYSRDEILNLNINDLEANESYEEIVKHIVKIKNDGFGRFETKHKRKDGSIFDVEISVSYWELIDQFLLFARDISERKKAEMEIRELNEDLEKRVQRRTAELELANKELETFSYSVSHDLRAQLAVINSFGKILLSDLNGKLDNTGNDYLNRLIKVTDRMNSIISDIMKLSMISRSELNIEDLLLDNMADNIISDLKLKDPARVVKVKIDSNIKIKADSRLLLIAMENLLNNAWKFTRYVDTPIIHIGAENSGNNTVYFISDNGAGFDMKYSDKLFIPFQRFHLNKVFEGSGIGLATVKRIINKHGGKIWAESEVNKGTTIYFTLPD